jgi:hypothetical protein
MTVLTVIFNVILIPRSGTLGAALGTIASSTIVAIYGIWRVTRPHSVIHFEPGMSLKPDFTIIRSLFRFGLPTGVQGIAHEHRRRADAAVHRIAAGERRGPGGFRRRLYRALLAHYVDVGRTDGRVRNDRWSEPRRWKSRTCDRRRPCRIAVRPWRRRRDRPAVHRVPKYLLALFGMTDPTVLALGRSLLAFLSVSGCSSPWR